MSVTVSPYKRRGKTKPGTWEINIRAMRSDGKRVRLRLKAPATSRTAAQRWGEARERELLVAEPPEPKKEVPSLAEFAPGFLEFARAERQKPSGIAAKERLLRVHLLPRFGGRKLDAIRNTDVQKLKAALVDKAPKTVNNVLTVLSGLLKMAVELEIIEHVPCSFRLLRIAPSEAGYHDFEAFEALVEMARKDDWQCYIAVLLGGEAGLRAGEMRALLWTDVDLPKRQMRVQLSEWMGQVTDPKGGRPRVIPMTRRLAAALSDHRHLRAKQVLCQEDGAPVTEKMLRGWVARAARKAGLENQGVHVLRHSFCSHLAMRGAPARAIQELAGHADLKTTQRYMHLSPAAIEGAVRLLDDPDLQAQPGRHMGGASRPNR